MTYAAKAGIIDDQGHGHLVDSVCAFYYFRAHVAHVGKDLVPVRIHVPVTVRSPGRFEIGVPGRGDIMIAVGHRSARLIGHHWQDVDGEIIFVGLVGLRAEQEIDGALRQRHEIRLLRGGESIPRDGNHHRLAAAAALHIPDHVVGQFTEDLIQCDGAQIHDAGARELHSPAGAFHQHVPVCVQE